MPTRDVGVKELDAQRAVKQLDRRLVSGCARRQVADIDLYIKCGLGVGGREGAEG